jgi:hypothetical protein
MIGKEHDGLRRRLLALESGAATPDIRSKPARGTWQVNWHIGARVVRVEARSSAAYALHVITEMTFKHSTNIAYCVAAHFRTHSVRTHFVSERYRLNGRTLVGGTGIEPVTPAV